MRKIYIVPNFVTTANMFCGFYSIVSSMHSSFAAASWAIVVAAVFDMLDGRIARLARATSRFGVEYDSLSDLVSFGLAPALLFYRWSLEPYGRLGWAAAFLFVACGALRLARFNVNSDQVPKNCFQGLPIPIGAGLLATFIIFYNDVAWVSREPASAVARGAFSVTMVFVVSALMVSTVRFPSFKELNWRSRASFGYLLVAVLAMVLVAVNPEVAFFTILAAYVVLSLAWNGFAFLRHRRAVMTADAGGDGG